MSKSKSTTPERPVVRKKNSAVGKIIKLLLSPFFFVIRSVFSMALLSVICFLVFYFKMHGTPEKEAQYEKIMEAMEQVPSVLGGLAQQAGLSDMARNLGYEPKAEDAQHSKELLKNLCAQLDAVDEAEPPLPWKQGKKEAPREDDVASAAPVNIPQEAPIVPDEAVAPEEAPAAGNAQETAPVPADTAPVDAASVTEVPPAIQPVKVQLKPTKAEEEGTPAAPTKPASEAAGSLPPEAVPTELEPILAALKHAKNLETIKQRLSVKFVGQHGAGAVLFLDKLLDKDQGLLRLAALESLRQINTPEALEVLHKHTRTYLQPVANPAAPVAGEPVAGEAGSAAPIAPEAPAPVAAPAAPAAVAEPAAPAAPEQPKSAPVQW